MKNIVKLLIAMLILTGCSNKELKTEPSKVEKALSDKYDYVIGKYLIDGEMVQYNTLNRNDEITITDEDDKYYYAIVKDITLAVDKKYVRTENEKPFIEFSGYTKKDAKVYSNTELTEEVKSFSINDRVKVLDYFDGVILVEIDGKTGYMNPNNVSEEEIKTYVAPKPTTTQAPVVEYGSSSNNDYQPSSSGGGSTSGGGSDSGNSGSGDSGSTGTEDSGSDDSGEDTSGDIDFNDLASVTQYNVTLVANKNYVKGVILMDDTPAYIFVTKRGTEAHVIDEDEFNYFVLIDGRIGKIEKKFIRLDSENEYEQWQGYAYAKAELYSDFNMTEVINTYKANEKLKVVDCISDILVVELEDGSLGYMYKDDVSEEEIKTYVAPKPTTTQAPVVEYGSSSNDDYQPSGGGGNSDSGGGSSSGGDDSGGGETGGGGESGGGETGGGEYGEDHL